MPSAAESLILVSILCAIFVSLPVAMLIRFFVEKHPQNVTNYASPVPEYAPPVADILPPPLSSETTVEEWTRKDAVFSIILALVVGMLMGPGVMLLMGDRADGDPPAKPSFSVALFVTQIIFQAGFIGIIIAYLTVHRKFRLVPLFGLRSMGMAKTLGMAVLWLIASYFLLAFATMGLEPVLKQLTGLDLKPQGLVETAPDITDPVAKLLMFLTLCVGAPVMEELIFRGVLYNVASRWFGPVYASVSTSLLFGVIHNNLLSFIPLTLLGICFAEAYRRTRSLAVPMLMHAMFNGISFLVLTNGLTKFE